MGRIEDEQRHVQQTSDLHLATIEALARAIDAKDQTTQMHIRRVQVYAAGLAKALGLSDAEIQGVKTAALLHDIGKLAVPEHILSKPGPLTQEEFQKIRIHPQVGAEIIAAVPFPYPVAPLILSHHERWDGKGYPQGLAGEDIPIGARILTIVDYYDAVTTERPYHKALSYDSAIGAAAGTKSGARSIRSWCRSSSRCCRRWSPSSARANRKWSVAEPVPALPGLDGGGPGAGRRAQRVREHRAGAPRDLRAVRDRAVDGHQPRRLRHDGADLVEAVEDRAVVGLRAVPAAARQRHAEVPFRGRRRRAEAPERDAAVRPRACRAGWRATAARSSTATRASASRRRACSQDISIKSAIVCPLQYNDTFIGCLALYHVEPNHYTEDHRRLLERIAEQAGAVIHNSIVFEQTQEDSLTDPLTGAAEPPLDVRAPVARAGARRAAEERSGDHRDGHRRLQGDQRHLRPQRRRPRAARGRDGAAGRAAALRPVRPLRRRRVHRRARGLLARGGGGQAARAAGADRRDRARRAAPASGCGSAPAPARRCSRTTARPTKRCSPRPIT